MLNFDDVLAEIAAAADKPWALESSRSRAIATVAADLHEGKVINPHRIRAALGANAATQKMAQPIRRDGGGSTVIVSAKGIALYSVEFQPFAFSTWKLAVTIRELARDNSVGRIILDIDSPGGVVTGVPEAADAIYEARKSKPVISAINPLAASAAYWLASQATAVAITQSGDAGSIGVFALHLSHAGMLDQIGIKPTFIFAGEKKVDANPFEPLTERAREDAQRDIDKIYAQFLDAVARGRNVTAAEVRLRFGEGRTMMARDALRVGMVDRVGTLEQVIADQNWRRLQSPSQRHGAAHRRAPPQLSEDDDAEYTAGRLAILRH